MLEKIYLFDKQKLILKMIRTIFEFNCSENEEKQFLTKITQIFYHSRRILNVVASPKIIEIL